MLLGLLFSSIQPLGELYSIFGGLLLLVKDSVMQGPY